MSGRILASSLTVILLMASAVSAQQTSPRRPEILRVDVGLGGHYRAGVWTPVTVTLHGGDQALQGHLTLTVPDSDGLPSRITTPADHPVELAAGQSTPVSLFARFGRIESQMAVEFHGSDGFVVSRLFRASSKPDQAQYPLALPSTCRLLGALGAGPTGIEQAADLLRQQPGEQPVAVALESAASLPSRWYEYESLDGLILSASKPEMFAGLKPDGPQMIALDKWIRMGGKLVLAVGSRGEEVLADGAPLSRFRPGRVHRMVTLRQAGSLEAYAASSAPIAPGPGGRLDLRVPELHDLRGTVEVHDGNLPLVIRRAWGLGQVIFLAADLDAPPLADWPGRGLLISRLLDWPTSSGGELDERSTVMHYGFTDISGQLRSALDQYPGVWPVPFSLVAAFVIVYVLLIGPADYFLLRKLSPWMELTWLTFPILVIAFSIAAYVLAHRFKGAEVRVNQVSVIDVDTQSKWLRGTSWANVFSPRMDRYDLTARPAPLGKGDVRAAETLLAWMGLPGGALGGMDPTTANLVSLKQPYEYAPELNALQNVPIQVWASKSFTCRWNAITSVCPEGRFTNEDQVVAGRVVNTLDFPLADCMLVHGRWAYELGTLEPGQVATVGSMSPRRELRTLMIGQRMVLADTADRYRQESVPYDPSSVDLPYIVRTMMFFQATGGVGYTGLVDRYQNFVDLSSLLKTDRVILVGTAPDDTAGGPQHGSLLLRDGKPVAGPKDRRLAIYRFVYPVTKAE